MVNVVVIDHGVEDENGYQRVEFNTDEDSLIVSALRDLIFERLGLEGNSYNLFADGQRLLNSSFLVDDPPPAEVHLHRRLDAEEEVTVHTEYRLGLLVSVHPAGTTIEEYERFFARKLLVRPARMMLRSLDMYMHERETLGMYFAGRPITISLIGLPHRSHYEKVCISVKSRREAGYLSFVVDDDETFDMLAGRLEREKEIGKDEEVSFVSGDTVFDNSRTFREYNLTHAKLQIMDKVGDRNIYGRLISVVPWGY